MPFLGFSQQGRASGTDAQAGRRNSLFRIFRHETQSEPERGIFMRRANSRPLVLCASQTVRRMFCAVLPVALVLMPLATMALAADGSGDSAIVWAVDVSGSMAQADSRRYWEDAVSLGADLAPSRAQIAYLAANNGIVAQTVLADAGSADVRSAIRQSVQNTGCTGYTDFNAGLSGALNILANAQAANRHLYFIADISEGGFLLSGVSDYTREISDLTAIERQAEEQNVKVHLLFLGEPPKDSVFASLWENMADRTGGELIFIDDPATLPRTVETLYFEEFEYNKSVTSGINTTDSALDIPIAIPAFAVDRARIYISASSPLPGIQARGGGAQLELTQTKTYAMIELARPFPKTVDLTLPPGGNPDIRVYLLADGELSLSASVADEAERVSNEDGDYYRQKSTVTLVAKTVGAPLFIGSPPQDLEWSIGMTGPDGKTVGIEDAKGGDGIFTFDFYPEAFGEYAFTLSVVSGEIRLVAESGAPVPAVELPVIVIEPEPDYALRIACGVGALLIVSAVLFFVFSKRRRKKEREYDIQSAELKPGAGELPKAFTGKLDVYGILLNGGKIDIPPASFRLDRISGKKWIRLSTVLENCGVPYRYPAAADIRLHPQDGGAILVKNHSDAVFYRGGQAYHSGQQAALIFGQKIYVVFREGSDEFEIYYHSTVETVVSGNRLHVALSE
jgi:Mg-chelatase subunit ChlD